MKWSICRRNRAYNEIFSMLIQLERNLFLQDMGWLELLWLKWS